MGVGLAVLAWLAIDLVCGVWLLRDDLFLDRLVAPFDPPLFSPAQRQTLKRIEEQLAAGAEVPGKFDPELGWCNQPDSGFGDFRYDWAGARIGSGPLAREKPAGVRRILAIGCSMTHGEEVGPAESWCAQLDQALAEVEVANLGVAAYGIDQALLRFRRDGPALHADEVWLGLLPTAALRVSTRYRPLLDHWSMDVAFKPAFVLAGDGALELLPCPVGRLAEIPRLLHDQRAFLAALGRDPWIERAHLAYAPRGTHWTHRFFTTRLVLTVLEATGRREEACFAEPPGEEARLFTAIVDALAEEARRQGALCRLIVLPGQGDLEQLAEDGRGYWQDWSERREREGLCIWDVSEALLADGRIDRRLFAPQGHYTPEGNRRVAEFLSRRLER